MELTLELLLLLFSASLLAGFIDSISGGGGLITLPVLMLSGVTPAQALATHKLQAIFGKLSSVRYFVKHRVLEIGRFKLAIVLSFIFGWLGALAVQSILTDTLTQIMPWMIAAIACYVLFSPRLGDLDTGQRVSIAAFSFIVVPVCSFYDGFFGPASGSFFAIGFIGLLGFNTVKATAHAKLMLLISNSASLTAFIIGGQVYWKIGLCMAAGQWIGARYGSQVVHLKGNKIVKPMLVTICLLMIAKMLIGSTD